MLTNLLKNTNRIITLITKKNIFEIISIKKTVPRTSNVKNLYKSLSIDTPKNEKQQKIGLNYEKNPQRINKFDQKLFQIGKQLMITFSLELHKDKKSIQISKVTKKIFENLSKEKQPFNSIELLNIAEMIKNQAFNRLQELQDIEVVYNQLMKFMSLPHNKQKIDNFVSLIWSDNTLIQYKIRSVCFLSFLSPDQRIIQLKKIIPFIKYFKSIEILILFYQKWRFNYNFSYQIIDQIHLNSYFSNVQDVNQSYFKMLFLETIKGQFSPPDQNLFTKIFYAVLDKPSIISHTTYKKLISFMYIQGQFVQSDGARAIMETCLNNFVKIAKNQNYEKSKIDIKEMVELYLSFQETNSTGQILLNQLTYYSRTNNVNISHELLPLFQRLFRSVMKNIEPKLKYQSKDHLNKEYTNDTLNFLKEYLPKYFNVWPEIILQLGHISYQLIERQQQLVKTNFVLIFNDIVKYNANKISLKNEDYLLSIFQFIITYKSKINCHLTNEKYFQILNQMLQKIRNQSIGAKTLQIFYYLLQILQQKKQQLNFKFKIAQIFKQLTQPEIKKQINKPNTTKSINSLDDNIIWLALCASKAIQFEVSLDESLIQIFINEKLNYMINSLTYLQVYQILKYTLTLSRLKSEIYEKLLINLSTFIISIDNKNQKNTYYLNPKYNQYYLKICKLINQNKQKIKRINNKNALKIVQIMFFKKIQKFNHNDVLNFMEIVADPLFVSPSLIKYIENMKFTTKQLLMYENSSEIRSFEYYNKSILKFYEGKYNESEVKSKLVGTLTKRQIQDVFSRMQVYKTIITSGQLAIRFEIPEPKTNIIDFKYMYICQKIFQKIKLFNDYDFKQVQGDSYLVKNKQVDINTEIQYIKKEGLIPIEQYNNFRVKDKQMPKYLKMEVWRTHIFVKKENKIQQRDIYYNNKRLADEILIKVIKGVSGNFEKIKQTLKQFTCNEQLLNDLKSSGIEFNQQGALIQLKDGKNSDNTIYNLNIICTSNTNYKILNICAYVLAKHSFNVVIIRENQPIDSVMKLIKARFVSSNAGKAEKQDSDQIIGQQ